MFTGSQIQKKLAAQNWAAQPNFLLVIFKVSHVPLYFLPPALLATRCKILSK